MQNSSERMREDMTSLNQQTEALQSQARVRGIPGIPDRPWFYGRLNASVSFMWLVLVETLRPQMNIGIYGTHRRWSSFSIWKVELEPIRCENAFFGSSMDLGLEPSAIFLSTQKSINKQLQIQNTGDLPVLRNLQSLPLLNRWPIDLNSFGAKRINWRRSNVMEVGDKNISKSPNILVFLKNAYHIRWFGMLMFFLLWCLVSFFSIFWRFYP